MRARNWKVGTLAEFYPAENNLLGMNVNRGKKICLRLRYAGDKNQFISLEQVVDTMLHELCHNVIGPHNDHFHAMWDQLRSEHEGLLAKGYTGDGFMSRGNRLGGRGLIPMHEAQQIARAAAEKRRLLSSRSGQRLGGRPVLPGADIRRVIVHAIESRSNVLAGCGAGSKNEREIVDLANQATRNGFWSQAEEDDANDRAIAQALWELVHEDMEIEYGESQVPQAASNPTGSGSGNIDLKKLTRKEGIAPPKTEPSPITRPSGRPVSQLVTDNRIKRSALNEASFSGTISAPASPTHLGTSPTSISGWNCPFCTYQNPINFLACDACTLERPLEITKQLAATEQRSARSQPTAIPVM